MWIGERAFKAAANVKEQIEMLGFLVKVYRSCEKCTRALDKRPDIPGTSVFVISETEAPQMLHYLVGRDASGIRVVVDAEGATPPSVKALVAILGCPKASTVTVACSWDEVMAALGGTGHEVSAAGAASQTQKPRPQDKPATGTLSAQPCKAAATAATPAQAVGAAAEGHGKSATALTSAAPSVQGGEDAADSAWTLLWISDQAFKPSAAALKVRLESLGCQVKGYKTTKNATRALDKKRTLVRSLTLVSGIEAAAFQAYITSRPELVATRIVVQASAKAAPVAETSTCRVAEDFDAALTEVQHFAKELGFALTL